MKKEEMNGSIKASSESIEKKDELGLDAMNHGNQKKAKSVLRKTFIISILLILCVGLVYAGVKTMEKRDLNNNQGEVLGNLENEDTDENNLLDKDINKEQLQKYFDELKVLKEWENKSFLVIDTEVGFPFGIIAKPLSEQFNDYSHIDLNDDLPILPEILGGYKFSHLSIHYQIDLPNEDAFKTMIEEANGDRFIAKEIETGETMAMIYSYGSIEGDLRMDIRLDLNDESSFSGILKDLEVIKVDNVDVFVTASNYMGTIDSSNKTLKLKGINHFETTWFDSNHNKMINVSPGLKNSDNEFEEEVNGEHILTTTYPENTKEALISFTELLHEALKSID